MDAGDLAALRWSQPAEARSVTVAALLSLTARFTMSACEDVVPTAGEFCSTRDRRIDVLRCASRFWKFSEEHRGRCCSAWRADSHGDGRSAESTAGTLGEYQYCGRKPRDAAWPRACQWSRSGDGTAETAVARFAQCNWLLGDCRRRLQTAHDAACLEQSGPWRSLSKL
jgi:hypothetical protein